MESAAGAADSRARIATYVALYWARRAPLISGLALAVSMYKPTFGAPLAVLMLIRGDKRAVLNGLVITALVNAAPLAALARRSGGLEAFAQDLLHSQRAWDAVVDPSTQVYGVDTPALLSRLLGRRLPPAAYLKCDGRHSGNNGSCSPLLGAHGR